ncbi:MAG: endonuclease/exonuclease/phosphatase family protein, partial [Patescibacteria group bacterium]
IPPIHIAYKITNYAASLLNAMKLITLNIWGGRLKEPLLTFFKKHADTVDIFCLQEVFHQGKTRFKIFSGTVMDIYAQISAVLPDFNGFFATPQINEFGLATFVRNKIQVVQTGDMMVFRDKNSLAGEDGVMLPKNIQFVKLKNKNEKYTLINMHGLWNGKGKTDTSDRLGQSQKATAFLHTVKGKKILSGDLNLLPATKSLRLLEKGMRNLVSEYEVTSTRSHFYTKPVKLADYILVSEDVKVEDFKVMSDVVSDHLPLYIEFT